MEKFLQPPEWAGVCVKLLQGPVYRDSINDKNWKILKTWKTDIQNYFSVIGINVLIDESDGYAFLTQNKSPDFQSQSESQDNDVTEVAESSKDIPKLIRKVRLSPELSLLCVLLREALDQFDTSQDNSSMLVMKASEIKDRLVTFLPEKSDQTKIYAKMDEYLNRLEELTFIHEINRDDKNDDINRDREFEIRRIIRSKVNAEFLEEFKNKLEELNKSEQTKKA